MRSTQTALAEGPASKRDRFQRCFLEDDFREGLQAFMDERAPVFRQRELGDTRQGSAHGA
ncbi:hypothetical protein [Thauera sp. WH-1]|uniref:hypothetical protein n=1 Tax=Thauera sp. WH-1 TaxID=3398230 RepID=UPI0039FDA1A2